MKAKIAALLLGLFTTPISLYLTYRILEHIKATEGMWVIFWLLIPLTILFQILSKLAEWEED
ncbi:MAG: hypothetical protein J7L83_04335 [Thaumarchaeota archaeon]|nr:hypothetical protein [Nitrososphaerota archaeon]